MAPRQPRPVLCDCHSCCRHRNTDGTNGIYRSKGLHRAHKLALNEAAMNLDHDATKVMANLFEGPPLPLNSDQLWYSPHDMRDFTPMEIVIEGARDVLLNCTVLDNTAETSNNDVPMSDLSVGQPSQPSSHSNEEMVGEPMSVDDPVVDDMMQSFAGLQIDEIYPRRSTTRLAKNQSNRHVNRKAVKHLQGIEHRVRELERAWANDTNYSLDELDAIADQAKSLLASASKVGRRGVLFVDEKRVVVIERLEKVQAFVIEAINERGAAGRYDCSAYILLNNLILQILILTIQAIISHGLSIAKTRSRRQLCSSLSCAPLYST